MSIQALGSQNLASPSFLPTPAPASGQPSDPSTAGSSTVTANSATSAQHTPSDEEHKATEQAAQALQQFVGMFNNSLQFSVDRDSNKVVVKVVDSATGQEITQIPSKEAIAQASALNQVKGLLVRQKA